MAETYRRWANGWCPCCAGDICESISGIEPRAIGEGVRVCGRCVENEHLTPDLTAAMLEAIALRSEQPIDDLLTTVTGSCRPKEGIAKQVTGRFTVGRVVGNFPSTSAQVRRDLEETEEFPQFGKLRNFRSFRGVGANQRRRVSAGQPSFAVLYKES